MKRERDRIRYTESILDIDSSIDYYSILAPIEYSDSMSRTIDLSRKSESSIVSFQTIDDSIEIVAADSYNYRTKRKLFRKWYKLFQDVEAQRFATALYENKLVRKCFNALYEYKSREKNSYLNVTMKESDRILRVFFYMWRNRYEERAHRSEHFHNHILVGKCFYAWRRYLHRRKQKRVLVTRRHNKLNKFILTKFFKKWIKYFTKRQYKIHVESLADDHYEKQLIRVYLERWRSELQKRELLIRVFSLAIECYAIRRRRLRNTSFMMRMILRAWYVVI
jgi:hypothetical protein